MCVMQREWSHLIFPISPRCLGLQQNAESVSRLEEGLWVSKVSRMSNETLPFKDPLFIVHMETDQCQKLYRQTNTEGWVEGTFYGTQNMHKQMWQTLAYSKCLHVPIMHFNRQSLCVCLKDVGVVVLTECVSVVLKERCYPVVVHGHLFAIQMTGSPFPHHIIAHCF